MHEKALILGSYQTNSDLGGYVQVNNFSVMSSWVLFVCFDSLGLKKFSVMAGPVFLG